MRAKTIQGNTTREIQDSLLKALKTVEGKVFVPSIAIAFISIKMDRQAICQLLNAHSIEVIGATSSGEFTSDHQSEGGAVILLLELNKDYYRVIFKDIGDEDFVQAAKDFATIGKNAFSDPAFLLCSTAQSVDGKVIDGELLLRAMEEVAGPATKIFGGMAGDDVSFTGTYVFANERSTDYGMTALVLDQEKICLRGMAISGWKPVGVARIATRTSDNIIFEIDGQPALDMYLRFLGTDLSSHLDSASFFEVLGIQYPFQVERENRDPMMCTPIKYDTRDRSLICEANIPEGSAFRFSTPPDFDIVDNVIASAKAVKDQGAGEANALLIFSCAGRLNALGPMAQQENEGIQQVWNAPMAGFYTYGEYGQGPSGKHEFYSTTNSWVALSEKINPYL